MYKLLLISDQKEVLDAFDQITNWELHGFKPPHIRHDFEGTKDCLVKHHIDGIAIALQHEEEQKILAFLQESYPLISIFEAGRTFLNFCRYSFSSSAIFMLVSAMASIAFRLCSSDVAAPPS